MAENSNGNNWTWVTHILAIFLSVVCMGLVTYCVVQVNDINAAKTTMGFSASILGVILGFYFNRERLTKESSQKELFSSKYTDLLASHIELMAEQSALIDTLTQRVQEAEVE